MKYAFLISGILELFGAFICYFMSDILYMSGPGFLTRLYGINALVLGIINLVCFFHYDESKKIRMFFLTMMFFHGAVAMMTYGTKDHNITYHLGAVLSHLGVFVVFLLTYMKDLKPDQENE